MQVQGLLEANSFSGFTLLPPLQIEVGIAHKMGVKRAIILVGIFVAYIDGGKEIRHEYFDLTTKSSHGFSLHIKLKTNWYCKEMTLPASKMG